MLRSASSGAPAVQLMNWVRSSIRGSGRSSLYEHAHSDPDTFTSAKGRSAGVAPDGEEHASEGAARRSSSL
jgi:hypothetical protein